MKKKNLIGILIIFSTLLFSQANKCININSKKQIIYYSPSINKINEIKKHINSDDFYILMDDEANYYSNSLDYLNKNHLKYLNTKETCFYLVEEKKYIKVPEKIGIGGFFIYKKGKYKEFVNSIDMEEWFKKNKF